MLQEKIKTHKFFPLIVTLNQKIMKEMKKFLKKSVLLTLVSASFVLLMSTPAFASSEGNRWYISTTGDLVFRMKDMIGFEGGSLKIDYKTGYGASLAIGRTINCWRAEIEAAYRKNNVKNLTGTNNNGTSITVPGTPIDYTSNFALMANLYYDFYVAPCFSIYLGGGIGGSVAKAPYTSHQILFAWQAMGGIAYDFTCNFALTLGYRFFATTKPKGNFDSESIPLKKIPMSQSIELGLRYKF